MRDLLKRLRFLVYRRVLHADDSPHRIALGSGLAMLVAFSPTVGFQTFIAIALATLVRANKAVCIPIVWITNPVTILPVYGACWELGRVLTVGSTSSSGPTFAARLAELTRHTEQGVWSRLLEAEFWSGLMGIMLDFGVELWVGCLVVGAIAGVLTYFATRWGVTEYRQRRRVRKIHRNIRRARARRARREAYASVAGAASSPNSA
ncbi:MAG: DUF2062 domain-containing protein [bacterium]|nr:DUF2062 domain-containing protein [bacterium]